MGGLPDKVACKIVIAIAIEIILHPFSAVYGLLSNEQSVGAGVCDVVVVVVVVVVVMVMVMVVAMVVVGSFVVVVVMGSYVVVAVGVVVGTVVVERLEQTPLTHLLPAGH